MILMEQYIFRYLCIKDIEKHKYFNGEYHNLKIFVLYREKLKDILEKFKFKV